MKVEDKWKNDDTGLYHCPECNKPYTKAGIGTHIWRMHGLGKTWTENNKNRPPAWNKGLTKESDKRVAEYSKSISISALERVKNGTMKGYCSKEYLGSDAHRLSSSKGGGYREGAGRSKKYYVNDSFGKKVCLQSSYELLCSEFLDELSIKWIRPSYLTYDNRKYFPDFLLIESGIYLDPKNDYLAKIDKDKIDKVCEQNNVRVIILTKEKITKEYLLSLTGKTFD